MDYHLKIKQEFFFEVTLPGSKSITNRALLLASLSKENTLLQNFLLSDDTEHMIDGLQKLGTSINISKDKKNILVIANQKRTFNNISLYTGNAGTMMRFLSTYIGVGNGEVTLFGDKRMNERPIYPLVHSLRTLGCKIEYLDKEGFPPIKIFSNNLYREAFFSNMTSPNEIIVDSSISSQYLTSLLLTIPILKIPFKIRNSTHIVSRPYIDMTLSMVKHFGGKIIENISDNSFSIFPSTYSLKKYIVEGDMSSASYFLAMALISNSTIKINNFFKTSLQGDKKFLDIFLKLGGKILIQEQYSITVQGCSQYPGINIDLNEAPDLAQTLAVVALFANSPTTIKNVSNMRIKETDRILALKNEINKLGGTLIEEFDNEGNEGFTIIPLLQKDYKSTTIETYDDHRMAMSFSLVGLRIPNIIIKDSQCVNKTFPNYFDIFENIYQ